LILRHFDSPPKDVTKSSAGMHKEVN